MHYMTGIQALLRMKVASALFLEVSHNLYALYTQDNGADLHSISLIHYSLMSRWGSTYSTEVCTVNISSRITTTRPSEETTRYSKCKFVLLPYTVAVLGFMSFSATHSCCAWLLWKGCNNEVFDVIVKKINQIVMIKSQLLRRKTCFKNLDL